PLASPPERPVCLEVDDRPVDAGDTMRAHKTTLRAAYDRALERHPEADDVILVNARGEVVETATSNVAARFDDRWWTPPLESGCLPGTARSDLLARGTVHERTIHVSELADAQELAVMNSVRGWRPARLAAGS